MEIAGITRISKAIKWAPREWKKQGNTRSILCAISYLVYLVAHNHNPIYKPNMSCALANHSEVPKSALYHLSASWRTRVYSLRPLSAGSRVSSQPVGVFDVCDPASLHSNAIFPFDVFLNLLIRCQCSFLCLYQLAAF
jgi:hypothetical protein